MEEVLTNDDVLWIVVLGTDKLRLFGNISSRFAKEANFKTPSQLNEMDKMIAKYFGYDESVDLRKVSKDEVMPLKVMI